MDKSKFETECDSVVEQYKRMTSKYGGIEHAPESVKNQFYRDWSGAVVRDNNRIQKEKYDKLVAEMVI